MTKHKKNYIIKLIGEVSEWSNVPASKFGMPKASRVRIPPSPPVETNLNRRVLFLVFAITKRFLGKIIVNLSYYHFNKLSLLTKK